MERKLAQFVGIQDIFSAQFVELALLVGLAKFVSLTYTPINLFEYYGIQPQSRLTKPWGHIFYTIIINL